MIIPPFVSSVEVIGIGDQKGTRANIICKKCGEVKMVLDRPAFLLRSGGCLKKTVPREINITMNAYR